MISSEPGLGTTVRVRLPGTKHDSTTSQELLTNKPTNSPGETILLVEDKDMVREPVGRMLRTTATSS